MVLLGILAGITILLAVLWAIIDRSSSSFNSGIWGGFALLFLVIFLVNGIVLIISYADSKSNNAALEAFYSEVYDAYKITAAKTEQMTVGGEQNKPESVAIQSEYLQQAPEAAQRLKELRDKVEWYNVTLRAKQTFYSNWFLRQYMTEPPQLPFIKLK